MKNIKTEQLVSILSNDIICREIIDDSKPGRIIEKIHCSSQKMFIKYGNDPGLRNEINTYQKMQYLSLNKVPKIYVCEEIENDFYLLALEWIEGSHPNFKDKYDISKVYSALGKWSSYWSKLIDKHDWIEFDHFVILDNIFKNHGRMIKKTIGTPIYDLLQRLIMKSEFIISRIKKMPSTLDPGDISLHNILIKDGSGDVVFFDFESAGVRPMIMLLEHFGEGYESIPSSQEGIALAMQSYFAAWNHNSEKKIQWNEFMDSQICAQANYKVGKYVYWFMRIVEKREVEKTLEWIKLDYKNLNTLVIELEAKL